MNAKEVIMRIRLSIMLITQALSLGLNAPSYAEVGFSYKEFIGLSYEGGSAYLNMCDSPSTCDGVGSSEVCDMDYCEDMHEYYNHWYGCEAGCYQCKAAYDNQTYDEGDRD